MNLNDPRSKPVPYDWIQPIADWTVSLRAANHRQPTITTRADHLRRASRALGPDPWAVTAEQLVTWVGQQDWATETRRSVYASLRSFWRWGLEAGHITGPLPTMRLPRVKAAAPKPRPAPEAIIQAAMIEADEQLQLILALAAEAGMRRAEIAQVHRRDLVEDLDGWSVIAHGKGGKDRLLPLTPELAIRVKKACLAGGGWAFPGDYAGGHWSPRWVGKLATRVLPGAWTLHTLRHRFATRVYTETGDLITLQELLGHASVATTQRYVATPRERLRAAMMTAAA